MVKKRFHRFRSIMQLFSAILAIGVVFMASSLFLSFLPAQADISNPIIAENQHIGSTQWQIPQSGYSLADDVNMQIKGYASAVSVNKGSSISFHITTTPAQTYTIDFYRIGWYGGLGGRFMFRSSTLNGITQSTCPTDSSTGMISCSWSTGYVVNVPTTWTSGVYIAVLTNAQKYQNYMMFTVRDDSSTSPLLYQQPVNTYQAYNDYPYDHVTGKSLYAYNSYGANTVSGAPNAVKVSFDRPYAGNGAGDFFKWEVNFIHWVEKSGYDITYSTDVDTHTNGARLLSFKGFLSVGHDEYWSKQMYDAVNTARDRGVNLGFFGANDIYWAVRYEDGISGPNRVLVCYRDATLDPITDSTLKTVQWQSPTLNRPAQTLTGVEYMGEYNGTFYPYVVANSTNWVYANTGFQDGDSVPGIIGYESDAQSSQYPLPQSQNYTLLSNSSFMDNYGKNDISNASLYQAPSGAWIFAAGTMSWSWALDAYGSGYGKVDARIQQTTVNILNEFVSGQIPTVIPPPTVIPTPTPVSIYRATILSDRPFGYWRLDETGASQSAEDDTGNNHNATYEGGLSFSALGALSSDTDTAVSSDGTGKIIFPQFPPLGDFSIEGWSFLTDPTWNASAFYDNILYGSSNTRLIIRPGVSSSNGYLGFFGIKLNGTEYSLQPANNGQSNINRWVYWTMVRQANTMTIYRNGIQVAQRIDLPASASATLDGQLFQQGTSYPLKGSIDEFAVYPFALSQNQINAHYQASGHSPDASIDEDEYKE